MRDWLIWGSLLAVFLYVVFLWKRRSDREMHEWYAQQREEAVRLAWRGARARGWRWPG